MDWSKIIKIKNDTSGKGSIDWTDVIKLGRDAGIVGGSAAVAYAMSHLTTLNLGESTVWLVPLFAVGLNLLYKWLKDNTPQE